MKAYNRLVALLWVGLGGLTVPSVAVGAFEGPLILSPGPSMLFFQSSLSPSLDHEGGGLQLVGMLGAADNGGTGFGAAFSKQLHFLGPTASPENLLRSGGWSVGMAGGSSKFARMERSAHSGEYFWELNLGRAVIGELLSGRSGLRGYIELAFRNIRPHRGAVPNDFFNELIGFLPSDHMRYAVLRVGTAKDYAKEGLVVQQSPRYTYWSLEGAIYFPLEGAQAFVNLRPRLLLHCGISGFACGLSGWYLYQSNAGTFGAAEDFRNAFFAGPEFRVIMWSRLSAQLLVQWSYLRSPTQRLFSSTPRVQGSLSFAF